MNVLQVARDWRRRLQQLEDQAVREATVRYRNAIRASMVELDTITTRIAAAEGPVSVTDLFTQYRLGTVRRDLEGRLAGWARGEGPRIQAVVDQAASLAPSVALEMIRARIPNIPPEVAASLVRHRPDETAQMIASLTRGSPLTDLLVKGAGDCAGQAVQTLVTGVALNQDPRRVAKDLGRVIDGGVTRARLITRTEMLRVTREAQRQQWLAGNAVSGWTWWSSLDKTTCMVCWAMHGSHHKLEEPFGSHPACRCSMIPDVKAIPGVPSADPIQTGPDRFAGLPPGDQRRVLGPTRHDKYMAGDLQLPDVVQFREDPRWGPTRTQAPVTQSAPKRQGVFERMNVFDRDTHPEFHDAVVESTGILDRLLKLPSGNEPTIDVLYSTVTVEKGAWYEFKHPALGNTSNFTFTDDVFGADPRTVFTHEFGHYIDSEMFTEAGGTTSAADTLPDFLTGWLTAITDQFPEDIRAILTQDEWDYFITPHEVWARSFAQWAALHSNDRELLQAVKTMWAADPVVKKWDPQWTDQQFLEIDQQITLLFQERGWLDS